jgi:hypothetical protein
MFIFIRILFTWILKPLEWSYFNLPESKFNKIITFQAFLSDYGF